MVEISRLISLNPAQHNFGKKLRALNGLTPFKFVAKKLQKDPKSWALLLGHDEAGPNTSLNPSYPTSAIIS